MTAYSDDIDNASADRRLDAANVAVCPSTIFRPSLSIDGDQWCALYGENLQDGVAGFGDSPAEAMAAFDEAWVKRLSPQEPKADE
ncbi:hypothetical protein LCGC14_0251360 [marine sediment metagenome]|uniref:Uncharacterized protein n=1 Tax=marine sediment metagenome TaxID=412755 RepID=A0A0F9U8Y1_9ZZZZ